jgi:hypothetical protein
MKKFAFVSRHVPTAGQIALAEKAGVELLHVGDRDGFNCAIPDSLGQMALGWDGVVCVHAAMAMRCLSSGLAVGIFNNVNRAPVGSPPAFETTALHVFAVCDDGALEVGNKFTLCHTVLENSPVAAISRDRKKTIK